MAPNRTVQYNLETEDGDVRIFDNTKDLRDFVEENYSRINGRIERKVYDEENKVEDYTKRRMLTKEEVLNKDLRKI